MQEIFLSLPDPLSKCIHWDVDDDSEICWKKQMINVHFLMYDKLRQFWIMPEYLTNDILAPSKVKVYYQVNDKSARYHMEEGLLVQSGTKIKHL